MGLLTSFQHVAVPPPPSHQLQNPVSLNRPAVSWQSDRSVLPVIVSLILSLEYFLSILGFSRAERKTPILDESNLFLF